MTLLGVNGGELLVLGLVAVMVVGPERLPRYAEQLAGWIRMAKTYARSAKDRVQSEISDEVGDIDWAALDPRQYDPRRIVREALEDDADYAPVPPPPPVPEPVAAVPPDEATPDEATPDDADGTAREAQAHLAANSS